MGAVNRIVGVCRFSYLGTGGFRMPGDGSEGAAERLYAPDRMRRRFAYFEGICLPALAAQTDPDFVLVVLIADTMPAPFRRRLKDLAARHPFLRLCMLEPAGPLNATRRAFRRGLDGAEPDFVTGFRLDDDDAVARDYIARTREIADTLIAAGWAGPDAPAAVCFHRGIYWDMKRGRDAFWDMTETAPLGLAAALVAPPDAIENIYRWNHRNLAAHARCWSDPRETMFLRTLHGHNDSDRSIPPRARPLTQGRARDLLRDRFGLDADRLVARMRRLQTSTEPDAGIASGAGGGGMPHGEDDEE